MLIPITLFALILTAQCNIDKSCASGVDAINNASTQATSTQSVSTQPADVCKTAVCSPKTSQPVYNPQIIAILDKLEKAGSEIKNLQAKVKHELYQMIPDDRQTKLGVIRYKAASDGKNAKFMISFDTLIHDNLKLKRREWFCFDGHWLREIRSQTKTVIDREIIAPDEKIDPFKLGQGPFPLPFGQKKQEILDNFTVILAAKAKNDPKHTSHLILIPKAKSKFKKKYKKIEFWIDKTLNLPVKVSAFDRHSNQITAWFSDIKINKGLTDSQLWIAIPKGYAYQKEPLTKQ